MTEFAGPPDTSPRVHRVCVVGSGWHFTSGLSYYACRLASALTTYGQVSAVLLWRLIPRRFYPGRERVGIAVHGIDYPSDVPVYDGIDRFWFPSLLGAIGFLRKQRPEVLILEWWTGAVLHIFVPLVILARRLDARVIVEFHEVQGTGEARIPSLRAIRAPSGPGSCAACMDSLCTRSTICSRSKDTTPSPAFRPRSYRTAPSTITCANDERRKTSGPETTVLFFGTIRPYKRLEVLVRAFDSLSAEEAAELRLLIVGEKWENWTDPLKLAAQSRHKQRITVVNRYVRDAEVAAFFDEADAVALPYLRSSASGPLHITMAHGLPVVLSDVGGLRDCAAGYDGVLWVPSGDVAAVADALRKLPGRRGERYPDPRSWGHTSKAFGQLIDRIGVGA